MQTFIERYTVQFSYELWALAFNTTGLELSRWIRCSWVDKTVTKDNMERDRVLRAQRNESIFCLGNLGTTSRRYH